MNNRVSRCAMFVTPTNPRFIDKAWTRGGDVYILDIEDSIAPSEKERCRTLIRESIQKANKGGASIYVRINKPFVDTDLPYAVRPGVDRIMLPKTESAAEMRHAHEIISRLEKERGIQPGYIELSPMIESALGAVNIHEILSATPRKIWSQGGGGGYDMAVNLGIEMFADFDQYRVPSGLRGAGRNGAGHRADGGRVRAESVRARRSERSGGHASGGASRGRHTPRGRAPSRFYRPARQRTLTYRGRDCVGAQGRRRIRQARRRGRSRGNTRR